MEVVKQEMQRVNTDILGISDSTDMSLSKFREIVKDRQAWSAAVHEVSKTHNLATEQQAR